jgi:hypothetical protein
MSTDERPFTIPDFATWKKQGRKISVLTVYDHPVARLLDAAGVDCLLVGDSMGTTVHGRETTLGVTLDQVIYHSEMVARAATRSLVVADLPFLSYQVSRRQAIRSAGRVLKETRCQAVKLEGGRRMAKTIEAVVGAEIPVMGHVGLTPQSIRRLGSYKVQRETDALRADAHGSRSSWSASRPTSRPGSPRSCQFPRSASVPAPAATARCWSFTTCLASWAISVPSSPAATPSLVKPSAPPPPATSATSAPAASRGTERASGDPTAQTVTKSRSSCRLDGRNGDEQRRMPAIDSPGLRGRVDE